jgi:phosphoglycolate phosphatase
MSPAPTVVLFDVDGTLIDTGGAGGRSWSRAFVEAFGVPGDIRRFSEVGMTDPVVARTTFRGTLERDPAQEEVARLMMTYLLHLPDEVAASAGYRVMPGVVELLRRLSTAGAFLGLVTGNIEGAARIKIERGDLNRYFLFGGYGSDSADRPELTRSAVRRAETLHGHALDMDRVFVVGDTPRDIEAAKAAGAMGIGVATGEYELDRLKQAGADHVLATLEGSFPAEP